MNVASNLVLAVACTAALIATAIASPPSHRGHPAPTAAAQPYAGQQSRDVSSLSADDVDALLAGRGWGLAKPAELNGFPGPMHVLELAAELRLTSEQWQAVQASFDRMRVKAQDVGARYVAAERAIDAAFRAARPQAEIVQKVHEAEKLRAELRLAHLNAHMEVTPLLTPEQRHRYAELRGYAGAGAHAPHGQHRH